MNVHLVFPRDYLEEMKEALEEDAEYKVKQTDTSLDTFSQWAESDDTTEAEVALIYGAGSVVVSTSGDLFSQRQAIFERLKEVRLSREELRMVIVFPQEMFHEKDFVSKIAQLGIYDIYFVDEFDVDDIFAWLSVKKGYSHVEGLLSGYLAKEKGEIIHDAAKLKQTNLKEHGKEVDTPNFDKDKYQKQKKRDKRSFKIKFPSATSIFEKIEDTLESLPVKEKVIIKERLAGSIFIAIVGVAKGTGATHLSLLLANYLARIGQSVALIEANRSNDFFSIEYVYEGGRGYTSRNKVFEIKGVDYYKSTTIQELDIASLVNQYSYIILDIGDIETTDNFDEFFRAHIQLLTAHGSEWKRKNIHMFRERFITENQMNWRLAVPLTQEMVVKDLRKEFPEWAVFSIPSHPDPFEKDSETDKVMESILAGFIPTQKGRRSLLSTILGRKKGEKL